MPFSNKKSEYKVRDARLGKYERNELICLAHGDKYLLLLLNGNDSRPSAQARELNIC